MFLSDLHILRIRLTHKEHSPHLTIRPQNHEAYRHFQTEDYEDTTERYREEVCEYIDRQMSWFTVGRESYEPVK